MKKAITKQRVIYALIAFFVVAAMASCVKEAGHYLSTSTVTKAGSMQFYVQGDTTHSLATPTDTVSFTSYSTPQTTITSKNGKKFLTCNLQFSGAAKGTFTLTSLNLKYITKSGAYLTTSNSNTGTVTIDSINANKGYISGNFTSKVLVAAKDTENVVGVFAIQQ